MKDLIERLRTVYMLLSIEITNEAADALERQRAKIERLENINRDALGNLNDLCNQKNVEIDRLKGEAISLEQEVAELRLFKHNMTLRYDAMNGDLAAYRNSFIALKAQAAKDAADSGRLRESLRWALDRVEKLAPHQAIEGDAALYEIATARAAMKESQQ